MQKVQCNTGNLHLREANGSQFEKKMKLKLWEAPERKRPIKMAEQADARKVWK